MIRSFCVLPLKLVFVLLLVLASDGALAQQRVGALSGKVYVLKPTKDDNMYRPIDELVGATVKLVIPKRDTLYTTTNSNGVFDFKQIPQGRAVLHVSFIGYKTHTDTVEVVRNTILEFIRLDEAPRSIEEVVVTGKVSLLSMRGDTMIYNAAAVQTLAGDDAIRIMEQLPGATLQDGVLKIHGEAVTRSYVNGKLLFGNDAMMALNNLLASDVSKIRVYDEASDSDRRRGYSTGKKLKVLDVVTKTPFLSSTTGHVLASMGADMDKGGDGSQRLRYGAGVTSDYFSEMLLVSVEAFGNNIGRRSNRIDELIRNQTPQGSYNEDIVAEFNVSRFWKDRRDGSSIRGGYAFKDNKNEMSNVARRRYFATESNPAMEYSDTTSSAGHRYSHEGSIDVDFGGSKSKFLQGLRSATRLSYETNKNSSTSVMNTITERGVEYTASQRGERGDGYKVSEQISWYGYQLPMSPSVSFGANVSKNVGEGWRVDSLSSTIDKRVLQSHSGDFQQRYDWRLSLDLLSPKYTKREDGTYDPPQKRKNIRLAVAYDGSYENSHKHQISLNLNDEYNPIDATNSMDYTYNYLAHKVGLSLGLGSWETWAFIADAGVQYRSPQKIDRFPVNYTYDKHFLTPEMSLSLNRSKNGDFFSFGFGLSSSVPSIEQITARITDTNPLLLSAGNPRLKATQNYNFSARWNNMISLEGQTLSLSLNASYTTNAVTTRSRYFAEPTQLPEWDNYVTQANATLSTFENVSGAARASLTAGYDFRIGRWATIGGQVDGSYNRSLAYIGEQLNVTSTYSPRLRASWAGVVATRLRYALNATVDYNFTDNTIRTASRNLGWSSNININYEPLKWLFLGAFYVYQAQQFYTETGTDRSSQMLNALVGFKALKGMYTISATVYDILNRGTSFQSSMQANYILDSWKPSFGRYWMVNIGIKFNQKRGGKNPSGGSMPRGFVVVN